MKEIPQKIILVDDEDEIGAFVESAYSGIAEVSLERCASAQETIDKIPDFNPDLILLDLKLVEQDGLTVIENMTAESDKEITPVIFLSEFPEIEMQDSYQKLGVIGVIPKPLNVPALASTVNKIWRNHFSET